MVVHRILKSILHRKPHPYTKEELASIAEIVSACERKSVKAERQIQDIKKARFLKRYLGQEMEGMICFCHPIWFFCKASALLILKVLYTWIVCRENGSLSPLFFS